MWQNIKIVLDNTSGVFTNLDVIRGRVLLNLDRTETFGDIIVKLECESRTRLNRITPRQDRRDRYEKELEVHKLLYKTAVVFPTPDIADSSHGNKGANYTLQAGQYQWPFTFKIPFNNACAPVNAILDRVQMGTDYNRHVKRPLPPSLSGFPGLAEIRYYVKVTAQRAAFYKENFRAETNFVFLPLEPIRPPSDKRERQEAFARKTFQFAPQVPVPQKTGIFRKPSVAESGPPPSISIDGRLPAPPILTCNKPLPLRVIIKKLNETTNLLYLNSFQLVLVGITKARAHELQREELTSWVISSKANLNVSLGTSSDPINTEIEVDKTMWSSTPLPPSICPSFDTCNLARRYELEIRIGLQHGTPANMKPEIAFQSIRMPCRLYSGIEPPPELVELTSTQQQQQQQRPVPPRRPSGQVAPPAFGEQPAASSPVSPQTFDGPPPGAFPDEPPPSYEDAVADHLAPVDGFRSNYEQPESAPVAGDDERPSASERKRTDPTV